jgi:hypothetical protein
VTARIVPSLSIVPLALSLLAPTPSGAAHLIARAALLFRACVGCGAYLAFQPQIPRSRPRVQDKARAYSLNRREA